MSCDCYYYLVEISRSQHGSLRNTGIESVEGSNILSNTARIFLPVRESKW